ncbi:MAG: hypothetical protein IH819_00420 [Bacteroidetes bacterium]|nr:hypothetical protein [Bacteroidota bacterium]
MRIAGKTFHAIADALGYTASAGAVYAVTASLKRASTADAGEYRVLTTERLSEILEVHWPLMKQGDFRSTDRCLAVIKQMRELLGLDAPVKVDVKHELVPSDAAAKLLEKVEGIIEAEYELVPDDEPAAIPAGPAPTIIKS